MISAVTRKLGLLLLGCAAACAPASAATAQAPSSAAMAQAPSNLPVAQAPPSIDGDWQGTLEGTGLAMIFHVRMAAGASTVDSPSQQRFGLMTDVQRDGKDVTISMAAAAMTFEGELQGNQIKGVYKQAGHSYPLTLTKVPGSEPPLSALEVDGDWNGMLAKSRRPITFHIKLGQTTTIDFPSLHLLGQAANTSVQGRTLRLSVPQAGISFQGTLESLQLTGTYSRRRSHDALTLARQSNTPEHPTANFDGDWQGTLEKDHLLLVFHIRLNGRSTTDMPQQHRTGYLVDVKAAGDVLNISMIGADMKFTGTLHGSEIQGTYTQLGASWPLRLSRVGEASNSAVGGAPSAPPGDLDGDWEGSIVDLNYPVLFHLKLKGKSTAENPRNSLGTYGVNLTRDGNHVRVEMLGSGMQFEGTLQDSKLVGTYSQLGSSWPLTLTRRKSLASPSR